MKFNFLLKEVLNDFKVKGLLDKNYFLASVFCMPRLSDKNKIEISKWTVHLYNPDKGNVVSVDAVDNKINISDEENAVKPMSELDNGKFIDPTRVIEKLIKNQELSVGNIMVTLHNAMVGKKGRVVWSIVFVLNTLNILYYDIDAKTGKILKKSKGSLVKRISKAS